MSKTKGSTEYRFDGQPLTPAMIELLIFELYRGKLVERQVIVDEVLREHLARGGTKPRAMDLSRSVKRSLQNMQQRGLAENPSFGYWRIASPSSDASETGFEPAEEAEGASERDTPGGEAADTPESVADLVVGSGSGVVYLYYLPAYRIHAEERGENAWPCKIGRTDRDPLTRVLSQAATALPEKPHIALAVRTAYPLAWESALQAVLTLRGLRIENAPGSEWFLTSPDEVLALARSFDPRLESG